MLKRKREILYYIFMVLFYVGCTIFIFTKPNVVESKDLIEIKAELLEKAINEPTGDNVPNIVFKIVDDNSMQYSIESCGFEKTRRKDLMNLKYRDSISFTVSKETSLYERFRSEKKVFSFRSLENNVDLLTLKEYNSCEKSVWKELFLITILLFFVLVFVIIENRKN